MRLDVVAQVFIVDLAYLGGFELDVLEVDLGVTEMAMGEGLGVRVRKPLTPLVAFTQKEAKKGVFILKLAGREALDDDDCLTKEGRGVHGLD